jgi:hypothetical protein
MLILLTFFLHFYSYPQEEKLLVQILQLNQKIPAIVIYPKIS